MASNTSSLRAGKVELNIQKKPVHDDVIKEESKDSIVDAEPLRQSSKLSDNKDIELANHVIQHSQFIKPKKLMINTQRSNQLRSTLASNAEVMSSICKKGQGYASIMSSQDH